MSDLVNDLVRGVVDALGPASEKDPDTGISAVTPEGRVDILAFRPGLTDPARAWTGDADWAAVIIYPEDGHPEVYVIPGEDFDQNAWRNGGTLYHEDYVDADQPGVLWVDLDDGADEHRHTRLARYRIN